MYTTDAVFTNEGCDQELYQVTSIFWIFSSVIWLFHNIIVIFVSFWFLCNDIASLSIQLYRMSLRWYNMKHSWLIIHADSSKTTNIIFNATELGLLTSDPFLSSVCFAIGVCFNSCCWMWIIFFISVATILHTLVDCCEHTFYILTETDNTMWCQTKNNKTIINQNLPPNIVRSIASCITVCHRWV